jgi:hypothetical protein
MRAVGHVDVREDIYAIIAPRLDFDVLKLDRRHLLDERTKGTRSTALQLFHKFQPFQHMLKISFSVKFVKLISLVGWLSANAETAKDSEILARCRLRSTAHRQNDPHFPVLQVRESWIIAQSSPAFQGWGPALK